MAPRARSLTFEPADPYTVEAEAFATAILDGRPTPVDRRDAVANLRVIERLLRGRAGAAVVGRPPRCNSHRAAATRATRSRAFARRRWSSALVGSRPRWRLGRSGLAAQTAALDPPHFVEEAAAAGIEHRYDGEFTFFVGGGVAAFDCDDDARPDLYFAGAPSRRRCIATEPDRRRAALHARPDPATDLIDVTGAYPLDVDGDRHTDLVVLRVGENVVLRGTRRLSLRAGQRALRLRRG